jgi:hypothetical protein
LISGNSSSVTHGGILGKLVGSNVVDWENELDIVLFGLFNKSGDLLGSRSIKEGVANLDTCEFPELDLRTVEHTLTFSSVFLKVNAIPPQMMSELTCEDLSCRGCGSRQM